MALTYAQMSTLVADAGWNGRVAAAVADVAQAQIRTLANDAPNEYQLKNLAVEAVTSDTLTHGFARLVAAGLPNTVNLATPTTDTGTDAQLRAQVRAAFDALVRR